jgi:poly-beta-1,6-N-acetyl-D-glucosamine synthase
MMVLFSISIFIIVYTYFLYPFILYCFPKQTYKPKFNQYTITIIIPAYNEIANIDEKIKNTLAVSENFSVQIILVSNGSNDGTEDYTHPQIIHIKDSERKGKPHAINTAMQFATGAIVILTDANTILQEHTIENLIAKFSDDTIGAVCGEKRFSTIQNSVQAENIYWNLESQLKSLENNYYTVIGAAGELFAIRRTVLQPIPEKMILDDFYLSMQVIQQGFKVAYAKDAIAIEKPSSSLKDEYQRRTRIASGVMQWLIAYGRKDFWNYNKQVKFQFFTHRFCRWILTPIALMIFAITLFYMGIQEPTFFYLGISYFGLCAIGWLLHNLKIYIKLFYFPFYFLFVHICFLVGYSAYFLNKHTILWQKAKRV